MEQKGDFALFYCTKGTLAIHKDIPQYSRLSRKLHDDCNKFIASISLDTLADEPASCVADLMKRLEQYVTDMILAKLIGLGIYDVTLEDFTQNNPAYAAMFQATQDHLDVSQNTITSVYDEAAQQKRSALDSAKSSITGPKHGMISNDPFVLGFYEARAERETGEQLSRAKMIYESAVSAIDYNTKQTVNKIINENALKNLFPAIVNSIILFFSDLLQKYTILLSSHGHFDLSCLEDIDARKSNNILKNLAITDSKRSTIFCALKACPFNVNIFYAMVDNQIPFEAADKDLLEYLDMTDMVCDYVLARVESGLDESTKGSDIAEKLCQKYSRHLHHIECIAMLKGVSMTESTKLVLQKDIDFVFKRYEALALDDEQKICDFLMETWTLDNPDRYDFVVGEYVSVIDIPQSLIDFLKEKCDIDTLDRLSHHFQHEFNSMSEIQKALLDAFKCAKPLYFKQKSIAELNQKIEDAWKKLREMENQRPNNVDSLSTILLSIVFSLLGAAITLCVGFYIGVTASGISRVFGIILALGGPFSLIELAGKLGLKYRDASAATKKCKYIDKEITSLRVTISKLNSDLNNIELSEST